MANPLLGAIVEAGGPGYEWNAQRAPRLAEQQRNALTFQQGQEDRARKLAQEQDDKRLAAVREDLASFYMLPDDNARQQAWQSGFAQHYGAQPTEDWRQSVGEFIRSNPGILGPELSQK